MERASATVIFPSRFGWCALQAYRQQLVSLTFGRDSPKKALDALGSPELAACDGGSFERQLVRRLQAFSEGALDDFLDLKIDLAQLTSFQRTVVRACRQIGYGKTVTYAELAATAGSPRAARAVGNVMANNRCPIVIPCHRVVGAGGSLGGYSAPRGIELKRDLLRLEGVL